MEQRRSKSIVREKSFQFAVRVVNYSRRLRKDSIDLVLIRQLLRSGTSIGANVEEALGGQSSKDFIAKLSIAAKESRETGYWLRLFLETQSHNQEELASLLAECDELVKILNSIILTTRSNLLSRTRSQSPTQNLELRTQNLELRTHDSQLGAAVDSEPITQNSELRTQNSQLPGR